MMDAVLEMILPPAQALLGPLFPLGWALVKIVLIIAPLMLCVAYLTFWERKVIGWMQVRIGPNRVGPWGLLQPIADGIKLFLKEIIFPTVADKPLFVIAPILALAPGIPERRTYDYSVWNHHRRLGIEFQIRVFGQHARGSANGVLRSFDGLSADHGADGFWQFEFDRHS